MLTAPLNRLLWLLTFGVAIVAHVPAARASISDALIVYKPGLNGPEVFASRIVDEATEAPGRLYFIDMAGLADGDQMGHATTLIEPGGLFPTEIPDVHGTGGPYNDVFGVFLVGVEGGPVVRLAFASDGDSTGIGTKGNNASSYLLETGGPVDATRYLNPSLQAQLYTATFQSGVESVVPEPASATVWSLIVLSIVLSIVGGRWFRWRYMQRAGGFVKPGLLYPGDLIGRPNPMLARPILSSPNTQG